MGYGIEVRDASSNITLASNHKVPRQLALISGSQVIINTSAYQYGTTNFTVLGALNDGKTICFTFYSPNFIQLQCSYSTNTVTVHWTCGGNTGETVFYSIAIMRI